jgi:hypothetical protein
LTLRKFLPVGENLINSWKRILHPAGNKWRNQLEWQKYVDGITQYGATP